MIDAAMVALLNRGPMSTGCPKISGLFFSLQTFRPINHNPKFLRVRNCFGECFFFGSPAQSVSFAICNILELEAAISTVFCNILEFEPLIFRGICNSWCSTCSCHMVFCNLDSFRIGLGLVSFRVGLGLVFRLV